VHAGSGEMTMQARPVLAVLDTNVVISGLLWEGTPRDLLARAIHGQGLLLAASAVLVQELAATLSLPRFALKIQASGKSIEELVLAYSDAVTLVSPRDVPRVVVEDIDDGGGKGDAALFQGLGRRQRAIRGKELRPLFQTWVDQVTVQPITAYEVPE